MTGLAILQLIAYAGAVVAAVCLIVVIVRLQRLAGPSRRRAGGAIAALGGAIAVLAAVALLLNP